MLQSSIRDKHIEESDDKVEGNQLNREQEGDAYKRFQFTATYCETDAYEMKCHKGSTPNFPHEQTLARNSMLPNQEQRK